MSFMPSDPMLRELVFGIPQAAPPSGQVPVQTTGTYRTTGDPNAVIGSEDWRYMHPSPASPVSRLVLAVVLGGLIAYVVLRVLK